MTETINRYSSLIVSFMLLRESYTWKKCYFKFKFNRGQMKLNQDSRKKNDSIIKIQSLNYLIDISYHLYN